MCSLRGCIFVRIWLEIFTFDTVKSYQMKVNKNVSKIFFSLFLNFICFYAMSDYLTIAEVTRGPLGAHCNLATMLPSL